MGLFISSCNQQNIPTSDPSWRPSDNDWESLRKERRRKKKLGQQRDYDRVDRLKQENVDQINESNRRSQSSLGSTSWWRTIIDDPMYGPIQGCDAANLPGPEVNEFDPEQIARMRQQLGTPPAPGGPVDTALPDVEFQEAFDYGYYRYNDGDGQVYGTKRTIWRLQKAAQILASKDMAMGIGDISVKNSNGRKPRTPGHRSHQRGRDVDLRLMSADGVPAGPCNVKNKKCYDEDKTFEMIKTMIDVDPTKVRVILINDTSLRKRINDYYKKATGTRRSVALHEPGHHNHVHFSWKE